MGRQVGIEHRYPSPSATIIAFMIACPVAVAAGYGLKLFASPWVALIVGLICISWAATVVKLGVRVVEQAGYEAALEDLAWLCVGEAEFRGGSPDDPRNLIAAAIVTLKNPNASYPPFTRIVVSRRRLGD